MKVLDLYKEPLNESLIANLLHGERIFNAAFEMNDEVINLIKHNLEGFRIKPIKFYNCDFTTLDKDTVLDKENKEKDQSNFACHYFYLPYAIFENCKFDRMKLQGYFANARFSSCSFRECIIKECNFKNASFKDVDFEKALIINSTFHYSDFTNVKIKEAIFQNVNLVKVSGLELDLLNCLFCKIF
ncbi:MAG: pentapeptide repeat-containing protein [Candidatus Pacearchaeota archaeon]